jgi:hypothetical protein
MQLHYSGPKASITAHGITYNNNKEDKFVYLSSIAELIIALNRDSIPGRRYTHEESKKTVDSDLILTQIRALNPGIDAKMTEAKNAAEKEIDHDLRQARDNHLISAEEREVLIKNITLMRDYQINRAINKAVYYSGLGAIAGILKKGHVDTISTPRIPKFAHVLHSLKASLQQLRPPIESSFDIVNEHDQYTISLTIKQPQTV